MEVELIGSCTVADCPNDGCLLTQLHARRSQAGGRRRRSAAARPADVPGEVRASDGRIAPGEIRDGFPSGGRYAAERLGEDPPKSIFRGGQSTNVLAEAGIAPR